MKFLIKFEELIDGLILSFIEKMKKVTPHFVFDIMEWFKHSPTLIKHKIEVLSPKLKLILLKTIGYVQHYVDFVRGHIVAALIYLRSDEFKNRNKKEMVLAPIKMFKTDPLKVFSFLLVFGIFSAAGFGIYKNAEKIFVGTKALRAPASAEVEEPILEFKKLKFSVLNEKEIFLDVVINATDLEEKKKLVPVEKEIEELLLTTPINITQLPLSHEDIDVIEAAMLAKIVGAKIKSVEVKQVLDGRPKYFLQSEKLVTFKDLNLQLFLEDTKRNRQVWVDFSCLASNRNVILFLKDHDVETRDYINMHVEPVIPQLPIEEEGRQIIKEKIKDELNEFLKANGIEGKVLEIYIDYLMVS